MLIILMDRKESIRERQPPDQGKTVMVQSNVKAKGSLGRRTMWKYQLVGMTIPQPFNFSGRRNRIEVEKDLLGALESERPSAQMWPQRARRQMSLLLFNLRHAELTYLNSACLRPALSG
jgi:hypothetical protein